MNQFHEKVFFGLTTLVSTAFSTIGAIMTTGETRWVYVTLAASSLTSGFLSLMFKRAEETIRLVIGRFGFAILGGILLTKPIVHHLGFERLAETDIISLAGLSAVCCIGTFFCGFIALQTFERMAPALVAKWFKKFTD